MGATRRRIGTAARLDMEKLTGGKVYLSLWVKVRKIRLCLFNINVPIGGRLHGNKTSHGFQKFLD